MNKQDQVILIQLIYCIIYLFSVWHVTILLNYNKYKKMTVVTLRIASVVGPPAGTETGVCEFSRCGVCA